MAFTQEQFEKGVTFLEKHDFIDLFYDFKIPELWHKEGAIYCLDDFNMIKGAYLKVDGHIVGYGHNGDNMVHDLIKSVGVMTCFSAAQYLYQLIIYVQKE
jgi:hypothetical protein